jgi:hypothetical protein
MSHSEVDWLQSRSKAATGDLNYTIDRLKWLTERECSMDNDVAEVFTLWDETWAKLPDYERLAEIATTAQYRSSPVAVEGGGLPPNLPSECIVFRETSDKHRVYRHEIRIDVDHVRELCKQLRSLHGKCNEFLTAAARKREMIGPGDKLTKASVATLKLAVHVGEVFSLCDETWEKPSGYEQMKLELEVPIAVATGPRWNLWALGVESRGKWHLFKRYGRKWRHSRTPKGFGAGREEGILIALAEHGGVLPRMAALKIVDPSFRGGQDKDLMGQLEPALSRLRKKLLRLINTDGGNPIPFVKDAEEKIGAWRSRITIGYAIKENDELKFRTRAELTAEEQIDFASL